MFAYIFFALISYFTPFITPHSSISMCFSALLFSVGFIEFSHKRKFPSFTYISFLISLSLSLCLSFERERHTNTLTHSRFAYAYAQTLTRAVVSFAEASGLSAFACGVRASCCESQSEKINETFSFSVLFLFWPCKRAERLDPPKNIIIF